MENLDAMKKRGKNPTSLMINMMHIRLAVGYNKRGGGGGNQNVESRLLCLRTIRNTTRRA